MLLAAFLFFAQQAQKFEVASVKPCQKGQSPSGGGIDPGRLHLSCVTSANLIRLAYVAFPTGQPNAPVSPNFLKIPIAGGPSWLDSDGYSIDAKPEQPVKYRDDEGAHAAGLARR
jgi:uncharacterized protein (TIGR03435 family)